MSRSFLPFLMLVVIIGRKSSALVVSAPPIGVEKAKWQPATPSKTEARGDKLTVRVRTTQDSDLDDISNILAFENLEMSEDSSLNWKTSMELLKTKASMRSLLFHRFQAIMEGRKRSNKLDCDGSDLMRLLWENSPFREKVNKAVTMSKEPHMWKQHNFALAPNDPCMLQHKMLTAMDAHTGKVVGFCEIAMLLRPADIGRKEARNEEYSSTASCSPTIANLVISSQHRRMGIATKLLDSAARYARHSWSSDDLGLYVNEENTGALHLYSKHGFEKETLTRSQWYMRRLLGATRALKRSPRKRFELFA